MWAAPKFWRCVQICARVIAFCSRREFWGVGVAFRSSHLKVAAAGWRCARCASSDGMVNHGQLANGASLTVSKVQGEAIRRPVYPR
jgi:hypothetical protein